MRDGDVEAKRDCELIAMVWSRLRNPAGVERLRNFSLGFCTGVPNFIGRELPAWKEAGLVFQYQGK